jgi:membrane fusion protein (multidrug efflux system)
MLGAAALASCGGDDSSSAASREAAAQRGVGAPVQVGVITLRPQAVPLTAQVAGRTVATAVSEIRPQVSGIVQKRLFKEGSRVKAGDVLYQIEDQSYRAAVDSAKASVDKAQAAVTKAQLDYERTAQLRARNVASQQALDQARAALLQAEADLAAGKASLQSAQINLDYTKVRAPISGTIGTSAVTEGALVTGNQTPTLSIIRQTDPMYVDLTESSATLLRVRRMIQEGGVKRNPQGAIVRLVLEDGSSYPEVGSIEAAEGSVNETTGTVTFRARIPNPNRILLPGMLVRAVIQVGTENDRFLLPQRAVTRNARGQAIASFVNADGKVETRVLETEQSYRNAWIVRSGVADGDRLIVDGLQRARSGQPVTAVEVKVDELGLTAPVGSEAAPVR